MRLRIGSVLLLGLVGCLIGCGEDGVANADPTGVIQGEVRDGTTGEVRLGVTVTVVLDGEAREVVTDKAGWFVHDNLPAGSTFAVDFALEGYATTRNSVSIDDEAGEHPQSNSVTTVFVDLFPNDNEIEVTVIDLDGFQPVEGLAVTAWNVYGCGGGRGSILDISRATTDEEGKATLDRLATAQTYSIRTEQTDRYYDEQVCITIGEDVDSVELQLVPLSCDGSPNGACDTDNPMGLEANMMCDCPGCSWDDAECP